MTVFNKNNVDFTKGKPFFGDELIVGYFILGFGFICTSYLI